MSDTQDNEKPRLSPSKMDRKGYKPGEILVKFKEGTDQKTIEAIQEKLRLKTIRVVSRPYLYLMRISEGSSVEGVMESLANYEQVHYSEPNYTRTLY